MIRKKGSVEVVILFITIIIVCIILVAIFLLNIQINGIIYNIKSDLFYIAQNAYLASNYEELAYSNYVVNNSILKEKIIYLLKLNHPNQTFHVNKIEYKHSNNCVVIDINLLVKPIVLNEIIGNISLNIKDEIKLKLMEVK